MDILLKVLGGSLGLLVPCLFVFALNQGIEAAPLDAPRKLHSRRVLVGLTAAWTLIVWGSSLAGLVAYQQGDPFPRVFLFLLAPVLVGLAALAGSADFRTILDHTPVRALVGVQSFRFAGGSFLLVVHLGILPAAFAAGAYGDLATASLATVAALSLGREPTAGAKVAFWSFTLAGLFDLLNVAYLITAYYPIWYHSTPSSAPLAQFALIMIPAIAAPFALLLHTYAIRSVVLGLRPGNLSHQGHPAIARAGT